MKSLSTVINSLFQTDMPAYTFTRLLNTDMNIGNAIRSIRKELNIVQRDLAYSCGITQTALSQIENGLKRPTAKTLQKICSAMDVPEILLYLLAMQEEEVPEEKIQVYSMIQPSITTLAMQLVYPPHAEMIRKKALYRSGYLPQLAGSIRH